MKNFLRNSDKNKKLLKKNLARSRKHHHKTCTPVTLKGYKKIYRFKLEITPNTTENMQACEKILQENLIPNLIVKDNNSHQLRDIASLPLKIGGLNIKLPSDYENFLKMVN